MTTFIRRGIMLSLSILVALASMFGVAAAQEPTCYPVPPGGCEEEPPPPAPTCDDIIAAIAAGNTDLDQNGDGAIDASDLPAICTCDEIQAAVDAGDLDASALPSDCAPAPVSTGTEDNQLAATGIESGPLALLALAGLFGGALLVAVNRKTVKA